MIFTCSTDKPKQIVQAISAISFGEENQTATMTVSDLGFVFATKDKQSFIGVATIPSNVFTSFAFIPEEEEQRFSFNLSKFVNCMRIFADSAMELEFKAKSDAEIEIIITDTDSITTCTIRCIVCDDIDTSQAQFEPVFDILIHSDALRELFRFPADQKNSTYSVTLYGNQILKRFRVSAEGPYGDVVADMPHTLAEWRVLPNQQEINASFSSQSIIPFLHSLSLSQETHVKISADGLFEAEINVNGATVIFVVQPLAD